jgi:hypothetical protein
MLRIYVTSGMKIILNGSRNVRLNLSLSSVTRSMCHDCQTRPVISASNSFALSIILIHEVARTLKFRIYSPNFSQPGKYTIFAQY